MYSIEFRWVLFIGGCRVREGIQGNRGYCKDAFRLRSEALRVGLGFTEYGTVSCGHIYLNPKPLNP